MTVLPEKVIEKRVCEYARKTHNFETYKFTSPNRRNVPDRLLVSTWGQIAFVEFKREGEALRPGQEREFTRLKARRVPVFVVDSVEAGKHIVDVLADPDQWIPWWTEHLLAEQRAASLIVPASVPESRH